MPRDRLETHLAAELGKYEAAGRRKGRETVFRAMLPARGARGPRFLIEGEGDRPFLRMNSNNYLGLSFHPEVMAAGDAALRAFGAGPGAVRFISGTWAPHVLLEERLAAFHGREAAMIFSSAYAAVLGVVASLVTPQTAVISDALNHNSIINAIRMAQPGEKHVYPHLERSGLEIGLRRAARNCRRAVIVTDGVFSMRGDYAPLPEILSLAREHDPAFGENVLVVADDSHGVGAFGATGRGTEEETGCAGPAAGPDILIGTLGKAFGVNGGYAAASRVVIDYLRETAPTQVYSNPVTPGEAAAAHKAVEIVDSPRGLALLGHLRAMTGRFTQGLAALGLEALRSGNGGNQHPIVPLLIGDTGRTLALTRHLRSEGILATGLGFPVVPRGEEEIRFQISADHTEADIDEVLAVLESFIKGQVS